MAVINTNLNALAAQESSRSSGLKMSQAMERLSTGMKINSAKDDAAGLAISNRMTSQIRGFAKAIQNTNDAISMSQTAEGAYSNVGDILQRMRELAVQSSSGTNTSDNRSSIQQEVAQLQKQIDDIALKTNHNNIKLLDGSASNVVIQTGINANDSMKMSFASVQTKDIGVGSRATYQSVGGSSTTNSALSSGALLLNGVSVGASLAVDDNASSGSNANSAIAKAAAINKVSNLSGVFAKAEATIVSGTAMTGASLSGTIIINGVTTDTIATTTDTSQSRKNTVIAVNAKSAQTGVIATDTGDDTLGVTLTALDGRNIVLGAFTTVTASSTGLRAANTTNIGSYSLYTLDGRDINVSAVSGNDGSVFAASGLRAGTYKSDTASMTSFTRNGANGNTGFTAAPSTSTTGLLDNATMIINGFAIGAATTTDDSASDTTATGSTRAASAISIAAAINRKSDLTGVTASAAPNILAGTNFTAASSAQVLLINNTSITVNTTTRNGVIDSINQYSSVTGVSASASGNGVQLVASDGRNISLATTAGTAANFGLDGISIATGAGSAATTYYSQVTLSSSKKFTIQAGNTGITNLELLGFRQGTFGGSDNGQKINQVDVSTQLGATQAIIAIDAALNTVNSAQATSGAYNNRLDSIVNNLNESSQNIQASRSRITDTDYAIETTNLAKQQIISQAATAMLAQANQQGQSILSLLK